MDEKLNMTIETSEPADGGIRANPSYYLDRASLTILMVMKLVTGLTKLCIAVLCAFVLNSVVSALNKILKEGSVNGKAMIAQIMKTLRFPMENIKQVVDAVPSGFTISPSLPVYAFAIFLPFVLISVLEAIALIRLRLGKGGTRTIGILHWIYCVLDAVKLLAAALLAMVLSLLSLVRLGGTLGIMFASVFFSLAVFYIPIGLPSVLYHRNIAGIMKDIRYEMGTGMQAVRRWINFRKILGFLMALEVAGTLVSIMAYWRPTQKDPAMMTLIMIILYPVLKLVKYICVMFFYQHFMKVDGAVKAEGSVSHMPQIILIALVTLFFVLVSAFICVKSNAVSRDIVSRVEAFFKDARETVDQVSNKADQQINQVEQKINEISDQAQQQMDAVQQAINSETGAEGTTGSSQSSQQESQKDSEGTKADSKPEAGKEKESDTDKAPSKNDDTTAQ